MKPPTLEELKAALESQRFMISITDDKEDKRKEKILLLAIKRWIIDREAFIAKRKKLKPRATKVVKPVLGYSSDCKCDQCERYRKDLGWTNEQR